MVTGKWFLALWEGADKESWAVFSFFLSRRLLFFLNVALCRARYHFSELRPTISVGYEGAEVEPRELVVLCKFNASFSGKVICRLSACGVMFDVHNAGPPGIV